MSYEDKYVITIETTPRLDNHSRMNINMWFALKKKSTHFFDKSESRILGEIQSEKMMNCWIF